MISLWWKVGWAIYLPRDLAFKSRHRGVSPNAMTSWRVFPFNGDKHLASDAFAANQYSADCFHVFLDLCLCFTSLISRSRTKLRFIYVFAPGKRKKDGEYVVAWRRRHSPDCDGYENNNNANRNHGDDYPTDNVPHIVRIICKIRKEENAMKASMRWVHYSADSCRSLHCSCDHDSNHWLAIPHVAISLNLCIKAALVLFIYLCFNEASGQDRQYFYRRFLYFKYIK